MKEKHLQRAIVAAGGVSRLAKQLQVTSQAVSQWSKAPAQRVLEIEKAAGGEVTRHDLRPDLYPLEVV